jgi:hypothetical protein
MTSQLKERLAKALIDSDPSMEGYHQSHIDSKMPQVEAILNVIGAQEIDRLTNAVTDLEAQVCQVAKSLDVLASAVDRNWQHPMLHVQNGCVCPVGAEKGCRGKSCPRRGPDALRIVSDPTA